MVVLVVSLQGGKIEKPSNYLLINSPAASPAKKQHNRIHNACKMPPGLKSVMMRNFRWIQILCLVSDFFRMVIL